MAKLLDRQGKLIATDPWHGLPVLTDLQTDSLPAAGFILRLENTAVVADLPQTLLDQATGIELQFPAFTDGRAYTQARELRQRGFSGDIRATGDVLADQLLAMRRCGFSSFALHDDHSPETALQALGAFQQAAQPAVDNQGMQTRRLGASPATTEPART